MDYVDVGDGAIYMVGNGGTLYSWEDKVVIVHAWLEPLHC